MSDEKKAIVRELEFGGLMHILTMNVQHKLLKELAYSFDLSRNKVNTQSFQGKTLSQLSIPMMEMSVDGKEIG
ncbi:hypothetical protein Ahy_A02g009287 [Arachis hypogaea]|uniref:Uncharacterized protein n=1 Tax=Arachis hypogaea TaxID=3818 RepID=A0A445EGM2_ARAHY|nr:hypothetical protein Ahy_A02g009287 [Arachis hypogaea]